MVLLQFRLQKILHENELWQVYVNRLYIFIIKIVHKVHRSDTQLKNKS